MTKVKKDKETWPGVEPAQQFIIPSYQWMIARIEAVDSRIQALLAFVATVTFAVPVVGKGFSVGILLTSPWFVASLLVAAVIVVVGLLARSAGSLILANPSTLYDRFLHKRPWQFWKDMLYFAGEHFQSNSQLVRKKAHCLTAMTVLFVIELGLLGGWFLSA